MHKKNSLVRDWRFPLTLLGAAVTSGLAAQTAAEEASTGSDEDVYILSPFEVSVEKDTGYLASETLAGTRIRTDLKDVGSAISVVTKQLMTDIGATDNATLLQYTTNAEVSGTRGTYAGLGNGTSLDETSQLRSPGSGQRVRGLDSADNTRDYFGTDIPWDGFNVDRIDIQRGPNSMLFGLGSPAGIINASTRDAQFTDSGSVEFRVGSYGSIRTAVDYNKEIVDGVLAVRVDALVDKEKFQQDPAFEDDERFYGTVLWAPKIFGPDFTTKIKVKYEHGSIDANRARVLPPYDSITPWFSAEAQEGMGKYAVTDPYSIGSTPGNVNPWLSSIQINQQHATWYVDGTTGQLQQIYAGYVNRGARNNNGDVLDFTNTLMGQRFASQQMALGGYADYARFADLEYQEYGQHRDKTLTDSSVFNFYDQLIDGDTKSEWEDWDAYNLSLTQMGWGDRVGLSLDYDYQKYNRGGQSLLGKPTLTLDLNSENLDGTTNENFARPMVYESNGGSGTSFDSDRRYFRASLFTELRSTDLFGDGLLSKILGRHRLNASYSEERYRVETRGWKLYASDMDWASYWTRTDSPASSYNYIGERPPAAVIYLGPSLASASSASGANISNINGNVILSPGSVYHFDSTWTGGTNYADAWTVPTAIQKRYGEEFLADAPTQASNPNNYVGWNSNKQINPITWDDKTNNLLTDATKTIRLTESYAGTWQGYMLNDAIVGTFGWRYDKVKTKDVAAQRDKANRDFLNIDPDVYAFPDEYPENQIFSAHSTSYSAVVHLNKFFPKDPLPINVSLSYNESDNFRISSVRRDIYGNSISNPAGDTKEYGITLSTKDGKYSFRVIKYETNMTNVTVDALSSKAGVDQVIRDGLRFRNRFLYRLAGYDWDKREKAYPDGFTGYNAELWYPAWVDNDTDRPVANYEADDPGNAYFETQEQAYARRDASIKAWGEIQEFLTEKGYFNAWNWDPTTLSALKDSSGNFIGRTEYENALTEPVGASTSPLGKGGHGLNDIPAAQYTPDSATVKSYSSSNPAFTVTGDTASEGYEFEFIANPIPNWTIAINASKTTANRVNIGGPLLDEYVAFMDEQMAGYAGDMRIYNGNLDQTIRRNVWAPWRSQYAQMKLMENAAASEVRKWRYNIITNYKFVNGMLDGVGIGAAYRWQDKVVIGYPLLESTDGVANFDISNPYYGPSEDSLDYWISYEREINDDITWKIQLNVRNAFQGNGLVPISTQPDGSWAAARIKPTQEWFLTNTFTF
ncbi:MAG: TonB-dependent receptor [Opitutales bacterium]|nr:TonB-dependent receptor [Opitutales bacterium]